MTDEVREKYLKVVNIICEQFGLNKPNQIIYACEVVENLIEPYMKENAELKAQIPQWHDLRKDPDDLPKESGDYWIKYDSESEERGGFYDVHHFEPDKPFYKKHWSEIEVMAWCELPKFEEQI